MKTLIPLKEIYTSCSTRNPQMKNCLLKKEYISPEIVISIMGQTVLRQILLEIRSTMWFSLITDEAGDISHYSIHEDTLGLVQLPIQKL